MLLRCCLGPSCELCEAMSTGGVEGSPAIVPRSTKTNVNWMLAFRVCWWHRKIPVLLPEAQSMAKASRV